MQMWVTLAEQCRLLISRAERHYEKRPWQPIEVAPAHLRIQSQTPAPSLELVSRLALHLHHLLVRTFTQYTMIATS
jgi:hypothetical protein